MATHSKQHLNMVMRWLVFGSKLRSVEDRFIKTKHVLIH